MYYHNDLNGLPQELTKPTGEIVWSATYDAMGRIDKILVDEIEQPLRFQGQYFDKETDLCYNRYRYYDPQTCSFISQDPLGLAAGQNIYAFAPNVWGYKDPLGLFPWNWNSETGMGHHLVPRGKANSVGLENLGALRDTPTFFPDPYEAGMHETIHRAQRPHVGTLQGPWEGSADELIEASRAGLKDVDHIKGELRIPSTKEVIAKNVTPTEAFDHLMAWHDKQPTPGKKKQLDC